MRYPLGLSPWSFNNLNSYNSAKYSLFNNKHTWEICTLKHLKVAKWEQTKKVRRVKCWEEPGLQPYSQELMARLILERGGSRLWLALPSAIGAERFQWASLRKWAVWAAVEQRPETLARANHLTMEVVNQSTFQTEKQSHSSLLPCNLPITF